MADQKSIELNKRLLDEFNTRGKEAINALYPDEIEYYACALELVDSVGTTLDFFSFPIMPQSMQETKPTITNIKKTHTGVVITTHSTFVPFDISINGHFGRMFRKLSDFGGTVGQSKPKVNDKFTEGESNTKNLNSVEIKAMFSTEYKTGYGCTKILEAIFNKAKMADVNSNPVKLIFYNLSLNSNYMVEPVTLGLSQNRDLNMIWQYNLTLKAVAPVDAVFDGNKSSIKELRSYAKKNMRMNEQSQAIKDEIIGGDSKFKKILREIQSDPIGKSAYNILVQQTQNSIENNDFLASLGKNITLNHLPTFP